MAVASPPERATDNAVSRGAVFLGVFAAGAGQPSGARCENSQGPIFGRCRPLTYTYVFRRAIGMKKKPTVTVDADVLPIAKQYARAKGVSLSSLIERSLRLMAAGESPSFASRIVTRNIKDYRRSPIPAISPQEALRTMIRPA